jgi:hypothetical protein
VPEGNEYEKRGTLFNMLIISYYWRLKKDTGNVMQYNEIRLVNYNYIMKLKIVLNIPKSSMTMRRM